MSDYKGIFAADDYFYSERPKSKRGDYTVRVIHRRTKKVEWTGVVTANSSKDAQRIWRIEYSDIRDQFTNEYELGISLNS